MSTEDLTPQKSLELITQVISEAKIKFEENGFIYVFWGAVTAIAAFSQFVLLKLEMYSQNWYPYLLMPLGMLYSAYYFSKKRGRSKGNQISKIISKTWIFLSINLLILGFVFAPMLEEHLTPMILILLAIGIMVSGIAIRSRLLFFSSIFINASAIVCFFIDWLYQPLLLSIVAVVAILIPGIQLMVQYKRRRDV